MADQHAADDTQQHNSSTLKKKRRPSSASNGDNRSLLASPSAQLSIKRRNIDHFGEIGLHAASPDLLPSISLFELAATDDDSMIGDAVEPTPSDNDSAAPRLDLETAATVIQRAWRHRCISGPVKEWAGAKVTVKTLAEISNSHLDTMIESSALTMTESYAQFATAFLHNDVSWYQRQHTFVASFRAFYSALDSWKRADTAKLLSAMERITWSSISVQRRTLGEGDEAWRVGIQAQRKQLLVKIRTLGGESAVDELMQKQRELRLTYTDPQPSPTPSLVPPPGISTNLGLASVDGNLIAATANSNLQAEPSNRKDKAPDSVRDLGANDPSIVLTKAIVDHAPTIFDLTASAALKNTKLAHDIVLDPDMRLEPAATNTLTGAVQQAVTRAFFDHIKRDVESGSGDYIIRILTQLRLDMRTIIPPTSKMHVTLEQELDQEWMAVQLSKGALDVQEKYRLVLGIIGNVCAPVRDKSLDALLKSLEAANVNGLAEVAQSVAINSNGNGNEKAELPAGYYARTMELIRNVRLDVLNYQLQTVVRPWLRTHAVEYERAAMAKAFKQRFNNDDSQVLQHTSAWIKDAASREQAGQCSLRATDMNASTRVTAKHVFLEAFLDLCFAPTALDAEDTPATLALDQLRIQHFQNEIQVVLSAAALCVLARNFMQESGIVQMDESRLRQAAPLFVSILRADDVTMDRIVTAMHQVITDTENVSGGSIARLVQKTLAKNDPVYMVMERRLRHFMLTQLDKDEMPGIMVRRLDGDDKQSVSATLAKVSLNVVQSEVCALLLRISQLCSFNWQVYSHWYSKSLL
ncbi:T-complex protein 11-domain-containing protein [Kickxella alabastrina]|uniref:T-complex protein 11-domain-containing protein n=1 Tax=Kickxella alabastrina TaxID=61397 RepID=UPI00221E40DA|nr:T-complex protein 11-domain-containing protein [Kickxella alabastrina]KAI7832013.1 T-complex protein 11-domain-containing protein [Kickxella alabastrina]